MTKITRDGAVEINKDSGEVKRVSNRDVELTLKKDVESVELSVKDNIRLTRKGKLNQLSRFKRSRKRYKADKKLLKNQAKTDVNAPHSNRLQFTDEERANPKLKKHIDRSEQAVTKLEKASRAVKVVAVVSNELNTYLLFSVMCEPCQRCRTFTECNACYFGDDGLR